MASKDKERTWLPWVLLIGLSLVWGSSFILIKKGLVVFSAGEVGAIRVMAACLFLLPIALPKLSRITKRQWKLLFLCGLLGNFFPAFLFAIAETQLTSALTGILNALTPLFVLLVGLLFFRQRLGIRTAMGLAIGLAGTLYLVFVGSSGTIGNANFYVVYVLLATLCYGINLNILKYFLHDLSAKEITSISLMLVGPIAIVYLFSATDFTTKLVMHEGAWKALFYVIILGVVGTAIALLFFNRLVKITSPIFTSFVTYLIPIIAVAWGILDNEVVRTNHFIGMAIIIAGIFIAGRQNTVQTTLKRRPE